MTERELKTTLTAAFESCDNGWFLELFGDESQLRKRAEEVCGAVETHVDFFSDGSSTDCVVLNAKGLSASFKWWHKPEGLVDLEIECTDYNSGLVEFAATAVDSNEQSLAIFAKVVEIWGQQC